MSQSVNGQARVPPGFRFHPTEEELLNYYLRKKVACEKIDLDVIRDVDLNKLEPWDIQEKCRIGSTPQNDWYFFSHKDKKYPTGTRTNRATAAGFWKATGRDKVIYSNFKRIGMRKTLVFYKGRAPHGQKSDWIMHEYRLEDHSSDNINNYSQSNAGSVGGESGQEDGWVVCRVFKKKSHQIIKSALDSTSPNNSSSNISTSTGDMITNSNETLQLQYSSTGSEGGALDQILQYMGRACKQESESSNNVNNGLIRFLRHGHEMDMSTTSGGGTTTLQQTRFMQLPPLESPPGNTSTTLPATTQSCCNYTPDVQIMADDTDGLINNVPLNLIQSAETDTTTTSTHLISDWATLDRLVASHLNGQAETSLSSFCSGAVAAASDSDLHFPSHLRYSSHRSFGSSHIIDNNMISTSTSHNDNMDLWTFARSAASSSCTDHGFPACETPLPN